VVGPPSSGSAACAGRRAGGWSAGVAACQRRRALRPASADGLVCLTACQLGMSREAFTLQIVQSGACTDAQINALRTGLITAVGTLKADGKLLKASQLVREAVDQSDLSSFRKAAIRAIPDVLIDKTLTTD